MKKVLLLLVLIIMLSLFTGCGENSNNLPEQEFNLSDIQVGEYIKFGAYEQDNNKSNGKEDIKWIVLAKKGGKILVISKYALDAKPYDTNLKDVTWETCSLRNWLNTEFFNSAFTDDEKNMISTSKVVADQQFANKTDQGNETTDKVFLLSIDEAFDYFSSYRVRVCKPTAYAEANGVYANSSKDYCWWWLRSPGAIQNCAAYISGDDGTVLSYGTNVNLSYIAVRPAMWINIGI